MWAAGSFTSDQFSQVAVTSAQLSGGQWIGPAVRMQSGGADGYVGIYYWDNGSPELMLFERHGGGWAQLGSTYNSGPLAAGTQLELVAVGNRLSFLENGVQVISAVDGTLSGGAPGIMAYGTGQAGVWSGGNAGVSSYSVGGSVSGLAGSVVLQDNGGDDLTVSGNGSFTFATAVAGGAGYAVTVKTQPSGQACTVSAGSGTVAAANVTSVAVSCGTPPPFSVSYVSTDSTGVQTYSVTSPDNGPGPQAMRVLTPTHPAAGMAHNFIIALPVQPGLNSSFGDGLNTLQALDAQDQYNLTIIEPTFSIDPWYADSSTDQNVQYESFMTQELAPWIKQNLATTGNEQVWLIGFSKSGIGGQDLILKHPSLFTLAASWDFPADMSSDSAFGADAEAGYGANVNFQANYELTSAFVHSHSAPFQSSNRIWIGGYSLYQADDTDYDALLTSEGVAHTTELPQGVAHTWDSGWVPQALAALYQDSLKLNS